jgi:hypothetical protein
MREAGHRALVDAVRASIAPVEPPPSLEARVLEAASGCRTRPTRQSRETWRPRLGFAAAGAATVTAALAIAVGVLGGGAPAGVLELETVLRADMGEAQALAEVRRTGIGRIVSFESDTLPILPKGDYYELWFVGPGDRLGRPNRISAGTFHPDEDGRSSVRFVAAVDPTLYPILSVTAEPGDGDPPPTGPEVLRAP